jgi:hypothetical protein
MAISFNNARILWLALGALVSSLAMYNRRNMVEKHD